MEKKNKGLIFLIIILILIVVGLMGYIVYDKFYLKEETNDNIEVKEENVLKPLDITNKQVNTLFNNVTVHFSVVDLGNNKYLAYLYQNDNLEVKDMDENYIDSVGLQLALKECHEKDYKKCSKEISSQNAAIETITKEEIDKKISYVFGDIKYDYVPSIRIDNDIYKYDKSKKVYQAKIVGESFDDGNYPNYYEKITRAEMDNNNIYIYSKVIFDGTEDSSEKYTIKLYSDYNKENLIYSKRASWNSGGGSLQQFTSNYDYMFEYLDKKLPTYKMTFTKENDNYYFKKVEKI